MGLWRQITRGLRTLLRRDESDKDIADEVRPYFVEAEADLVARGGDLHGRLFGVTRLDPFTYVGVVAVLAGVSAVACSVPALRAARVDPVATLRTE